MQIVRIQVITNSEQYKYLLKNLYLVANIKLGEYLYIHGHIKQFREITKDITEFIIEKQ